MNNITISGQEFQKYGNLLFIAKLLFFLTTTSNSTSYFKCDFKFEYKTSLKNTYPSVLNMLV